MTLAVEYLPLSDLLPYARNSRTHSDEQVAQIAASIKAFGFTNPILISEDADIIAGHGRALAAHKLKMEQVPCIRLAYLSETQRKAYVIADNRLALNAGWDTSMLSLELQELKLEEFDLGLLGFGEDELAALLNPEQAPTDGLTDPDEVPENVESKCKNGDLFILGTHRLLCGDSTDVLAVERLMGGEKAQTFFIDPPYGDNVGGYSPIAANERTPGRSIIERTTFIANDKNILWLEEVFNLVPGFLEEPSTKMIFFKWDKYPEIIRMASIFGKPSACCVWDRVRRANNFFRFQPQHEFCLHWGSQEDKKEPLSLSNVWHVPKEDASKELHPTVKPQAVLEPVIRVTTQNQSIVLDLFLGSGSTLIACEKTGRRCFGMEIDPHYCDVIIKRWEDFTGKQASRISEVTSECTQPEAMEAGAIGKPKRKDAATRRAKGNPRTKRDGSQPANSEVRKDDARGVASGTR